VNIGVACKAPICAPDRLSALRRLPGSVRLSWDSSSCVIGPSSDMSCCASTPRRHCCHCSARRCQATDTFRPRGFSPPQRFTPRTSLGFIAPRNRIEFAAFPGCVPIIRRPKSTTDGRRSPFPATRFTPFEEFRSSIAVPHHCGRYPLAVLSLHCRLCAEAPNRSSRVPTSRRAIHLSHSRSRSSAFGTSPLRSPLTGHPRLPKQLVGPVALCSLPSPKGRLPVDSIDAEAPIVKLV
jgi:hypothetical protein